MLTSDVTIFFDAIFATLSACAPDLENTAKLWAFAKESLPDSELEPDLEEDLDDDLELLEEFSTPTSAFIPPPLFDKDGPLFSFLPLLAVSLSSDPARDTSVELTMTTTLGVFSPSSPVSLLVSPPSDTVAAVVYAAAGFPPYVPSTPTLVLLLLLSELEDEDADLDLLLCDEDDAKAVWICGREYLFNLFLVLYNQSTQSYL